MVMRQGDKTVEVAPAGGASIPYQYAHANNSSELLHALQLQAHTSPSSCSTTLRLLRSIVQLVCIAAGMVRMQVRL
jgi:hypothetical protein